MTDDKTTVTCPAGDIPPLGSIVCTATHTITQADLDAGSVTNTAQAHAGGVNSNQDQATVTAKQSPALHLVKSAAPSTYDHVGQLITYTYEVTNTGNVTLVGQTTITDDKVTVICPPSSALAPGQSIVCTATHLVTQADLDAGKIVNVATASNGVVTSPSDTATVSAAQTKRLTVAKSSTTTSLSAPQTVNYTYVVTNTGNVTLTGIALADNNDNDNMSCPATTLAPGNSMTCTATHTFTQAELDAKGSPVAGSGNLANTVTATSNEAQPATANLAIPIVQSPALTLDKSAQPLSYDQVGQVISYSYKITNTGNVTLAGPFTVNDNKVTVTCPATPSLAPGASITCTASHTVTQADLDAGQIVNTASATNGAVTSPPKTVTVDAVQRLALSVVKSSPTTALTAPQTVNYSYVVTNTGNVTLTGIALADDNDNNNLSCPGTSLPPGGSMLCTATHTFTQAELDANGSPTAGSGKLANTVTATSNEAPPATDNLEIPIVRRPELKLVKSASPLVYDHVGQTITYTYTVTNAGNVTLLGQIIVTDNKVTVNCPPSTTLAPGASTTCTATHTVTQADLDANQIVNVASASNGVISSPPDTATVKADQNALLSVVKSSTTASLSAPQTVGYSYVVTNIGNVTVTGISLVDDNASAVTCPATTLAPAASMTCTATHVFTQAELDANGSPTAGSGKLANTVTATSNQAPPAKDDLAIQIVQSPALTLNKSAQPLAYDHVNQVISYTYVVTNTGNVTLQGPFTVNDNKVTVTCPVTASLAPGASITCTASHTVIQADLDAGQIVNTASATNGPVTSPPTTVTVGALPTQSLSVVKSSPTTGLTTPQTVNYSYVVTNTGNVTLTGIALADDNDNNNLSCPQTTLAPATSMTCTATHTFTQAELDANGSPTAGSGKLANTVTATSNESPPATDNLQIPIVRAPELKLVKSASPLSYDHLGQTITYTYTVTNVGNVTLLGQIIVTDNKLTVTCPLSTTLAPGASTTCTASHLVTQADLDAGEIVNVASASNGVVTSPPDTATVKAQQNAVLSVVKSSTTASLSAPQTVSYSYLVTNTGNVTLTGIALVDDNASAVNCPATSLPPGGR